jgi:hypothetical protein
VRLGIDREASYHATGSCEVEGDDVDKGGGGNVTVSRMVVSTMYAYTRKGWLHACRQARPSSKRAVAVKAKAKEEKDAMQSCR